MGRYTPRCTGWNAKGGWPPGGNRPRRSKSANSNIIGSLRRAGSSSWPKSRNGIEWRLRSLRSCGPPRNDDVLWWRRKNREEELERELRSDLELEAEER